MAHDEQGLYCDICDERVDTLNVINYRFSFEPQDRRHTTEICDECIGNAITLLSAPKPDAALGIAPHNGVLILNPETREDTA